MGQVYKARDSKLKREVEIKILPEELSVMRTVFPQNGTRFIAAVAVEQSGTSAAPQIQVLLNCSKN